MSFLYIGTGNQQQGDQSWLHNLSYVPSKEDSSDSSSTDYAYTPKPKRLKKKNRHPDTKATAQQLSNTGAYRIDTKPDLDNLHYDSVYSGSVAVYRRRFDCLGLRANQKLKWSDGRSKLSKRQKKVLAGEVRYFTGRLRHAASEVTIPKKLKHYGVNSLSEFVRIEESGAADIKEDADDSLTAERYMSKLTGEYNHSLLEQPHNVDMWLEFLTFQDQLLEWGHLPGEGSDHTARKKQALTERKVAIYERALEQNPMSEELLLGHMSLVREKWDTEKIVKRWKDIVFHQPNRPRLWLGYIHFCKTNFSSFTSTSLISLYTKCITTLSSIVEGTLKSHLPLLDTPSYMLTIFSLYCSYLKQVGLTERAVASYQALIEFNLCLPSEVEGGDISLQALKEFLEPFWDSGTPRFGEGSAFGWSNWTKMNEGKVVNTQPLGLLPHQLVPLKKDGVGSEEGEEVEDPEVALVSSLLVPQAWLKLEDHRMTHNCFPWQPDVARGETVEDCSDPDRIVTFDDVSQTLFRITDPDFKSDLIISFLSFLGAPVCSPTYSHVGGGVSSSLESVDEISCATCTILDPEDDACRSEHLPSGLGVTASFTPSSSLMDLATILSTRTLSSSLPLPKSPTKTRDVCNFISYVCNHALDLLPSMQHQTKIAQVWLSHLHNQLQYECCNGPPTIIKAETRSIEKLWKELLRLECHRNNFSLWNSYALFQYSLGNIKEAKKLYQSIFSQTCKPCPTLCRCLCECFMGLRWSVMGRGGEADMDQVLVLHALVCLTEGKNSPVTAAVSPARLLKARTHFSTSSDHALVYSADTVLCHCYFEYLTRSLKEAFDVLDKWKLRQSTEEWPKRGASNCLKVVYVKQLQLLEHHSLTHFLQPTIIRDFLKSALEVFPEDSRFMAAFVRHERQTFISGRMRRYFDKAAEEARSALPWLFALLAELDRYSRVTGRRVAGGDGDGVSERRGEGVEEMSVGTVCRIMSMLSRATASDSGRHCPLLWRLYMAIQASP